MHGFLEGVNFGNNFGDVWLVFAAAFVGSGVVAAGDARSEVEAEGSQDAGNIGNGKRELGITKRFQIFV